MGETGLVDPAGIRPPISVVVLAHNEEANLPGCLDSLTAFDDVHVLDSGSTDRTVVIAQERNILVHHNPFHGFGQQRTWAIKNVPARHAWQFHLDADERLVPDLIAEMVAAIRAKPEIGGYFVPSKLMFAGRWLRYAGDYPAYQVRFFHRERLTFIDHGHGQREQTSFPLGRLKNPYLHFAFSKGLDQWFAKHAVYARGEAEEFMSQQQGSASTNGESGSLFSTNPVLRRRALKRFSYSLPGRYFLRLFYMIFIKGAFLDGTGRNCLRSHDGDI